jgi:hypothetical protein
VKRGAIRFGRLNLEARRCLAATEAWTPRKVRETFSKLPLSDAEFGTIAGNVAPLHEVTGSRGM